MDKFEIKEGNIADLPMIVGKAKIFNELAKDGYGQFLTYDLKSVSLSITGVVAGGGKFWVLWRNDEFAGILLGHIQPNFYNHSQLIAACIFIAVLPEYQRTQWGTKLKKKFEDWGKEQGASFVGYGGYDKNFVRTMKRKGYTPIETMLMKEM